MFKLLRRPAGIILLLAVVGVFLTLKEADIKGEREQLEKEQLAFDAQRKGQLTRLRIGFLPIGNNPGGKVNTSTFEDSLANHLGIPVTSASIGSTYTDTVNALAEGTIEVAWLGPLSYLYAHQKYGAKVILCLLRHRRQKTYQSYIITNVTTGIRTLQDLKGQPFAFVDPFSTSGNLVPRYVLKKAGLDPDKDIRGIYAGSHEDVFQGVLSGKYPAGAVASDNYDLDQQELRQKGSQKDALVILAKSMDIPEGPIALRKDIQLYDTLHVEDAFLTIGENDPAILNTIGIAGFAKVTDETYDSLLDMARYLNIDLSTYNG
ncbi:phosphate/phosphite/phosphonate ABC transporter substrate-binding protein [Ktedonosporobacter rubrisoli]|uniref:phosphate/phosphite/phosphonate ABC transporter substrate-binding protein n=1 Tax=Ktedonosporobacter rubrisoli TaxID=2509675 RepID=UPI0013EE7BAE|nr:phosphate/phosphite/phosphonate ABC transporter substrate-binding protein [Ktedonosporobacter rubrisoli]